MKKVITMVGTSIFESYMEEIKDDEDFSYKVDYLKDKSAQEFEGSRRRINSIKEKLKGWIGKEKNKQNISAEVKSLMKLQEELREEVEIYLLCSDTILSKLAGEILEEYITENLNDFNVIDVKCDEIDKLQVKDREEFSDGLVNLINKIYHIAGGYWGNLIINITGGFKATVPYLTILAQVNRCPIYYIFEETDTLIKIPYIPLSINWDIFKENEEFFRRLEREGLCKLPLGIPSKDVESLVEIRGGSISLNPLGVALWEKYKEGFDIFYISQTARAYVENKPDYRIICEKTFIELKRRLKLNTQDPDLHHKLKGIDLKNFECFKHKENNLQVRVAYKVDQWQTQYGSEEVDIYIGLIAIGSDVHNASSESEYVESFEREISKVQNLNEYETYRISREKAI
jgi:putative CRISPR-associated protein (TIGR02619 family)